MTTFFCVVAAFVLEIAFGLMSDAAQDAWDIEKMQAQTMLFGFAAITALSYRRPRDKGMILLASIWAAWVAATDWMMPKDWPSWVSTAEGAFFLACLLWLWWADDRVSRGKETGRPAWHGDLSFDGQGGRRRPHRK